MIFETLHGDRVIEAGDGCHRHIFEKQNRAAFASMVQALQDRGATLKQQHEIGENHFATLQNEEGQIALSYFHYNHTISLVTDPLCGRVAPPLATADCERLTTPKLGYLGLRSPTASGEGNGMGFVLTLSDGSFIIYDGGYYEDAEGLLTYLDEHNVRAEKPRIAAWVLTHSHGDHYFAMHEISRKYADRLTVEQFIVNVRDRAFEHEQYENYLSEHFAGETLPLFEGATLVRPHTGQLLYYRDAAIEILSTQEEILPSHFRWLNETSLVSRVYLGGNSILFPVDAELGVDVMIPAMYGDALKSDFLQQTHHAFSGGSYVFYDLVQPKVVFWTCNEAKFEKFTAPQYNNGYNYYLRGMTDKHYHFGHGDVTVELPYKE